MNQLQVSIEFDQNTSLMQKNLKSYKRTTNDSYKAIKDQMSPLLKTYLHDAKYIKKINKKGEEYEVLSRMGKFLANKIPPTSDELLRRYSQLMKKNHELTNYNKQLKESHAKKNNVKGRLVYNKQGKIGYKIPKRFRGREMFGGGDDDAPPEFLGADFHPDAPYLDDDGLY